MFWGRLSIWLVIANVGGSTGAIVADAAVAVVVVVAGAVCGIAPGMEIIGDAVLAL